MKTIGLVQPIFSPNAAQAERNLKSIRSLAAHLATFPTSGLSLTFGGWGVEPFLNETEREIRSLFGTFGPTIVLFERNFGKAFVVNSLVSDISRKGQLPDLLFLIDSDIIFSAAQPRIFDRIRSLCSAFVSRAGKPFGIMALDQNEGCVHNAGARKNPTTFVTGSQEEVVFLPDGPSGIGGGCIVCSIDAWVAVNGYRQMGVYAGDDAYLFRDIFDAGFSCGLCSTIRIIHPPDPDPDYGKWKKMVCYRDSDGSNRHDLSEHADEAEQFWKRNA